MFFNTFLLLYKMDKKKNNLGMNFKGKINAPTMAYKTVYGKYPEEPLRGRTDSQKKIWRGIDVDKNLKDEWLEKLNSLDVEIRSTDEGKSDERVAFVIFRMPKGKDKFYKKVERNLKKENDLFVSSDIGMGDRPRICIAKNIKVGDNGWEEWWSSLPKKIEMAYKKAVNQS
jgi:hypothetical protein